jgi:hypothetical protein
MASATAENDHETACNDCRGGKHEDFGIRHRSLRETGDQGSKAQAEKVDILLGAEKYRINMFRARPSKQAKPTHAHRRRGDLNEKRK